MMRQQKIFNRLDCRIEQNEPFGMLLTPRRPGQDIRELSAAALRELAREHHLVILRGFSSAFSEPVVLAEYARHLGEIMTGPFGAVLDEVEHRDATDHTFDSSYMPLHWDGMYTPATPEFQLFHCVAAPSCNEGGRTTFVDTMRLIANASARQLAQWKDISVTYRVKQVVHYGGEICSPLLVEHPNGNGLVMRYNEPPIQGKTFLNKHVLTYHGIAQEQLAAFYDDLQRMLYDQRSFYAHAWFSGDVVITDNFSLLHGREGFSARSARHLQRVHIHGHPIHINAALKSPIKPAGIKTIPKAF
jgi:alpha-ketoglutarate-dependent taurine dioxygenase